MALINWRVPARLRGKFVLLKRAIGMVASAFQLAGERGIVASRARGLRVGRASDGAVVGQTIDDVVGAAQEPVDYGGDRRRGRAGRCFQQTATFDETRRRLTTATDLAQAGSGPSVPPLPVGIDRGVVGVGRMWRAATSPKPEGDAPCPGGGPAWGVTQGTRGVMKRNEAPAEPAVFQHEGTAATVGFDSGAAEGAQDAVLQRAAGHAVPVGADEQRRGRGPDGQTPAGGRSAVSPSRGTG